MFWREGDRRQIPKGFGGGRARCAGSEVDAVMSRRGEACAERGEAECRAVAAVSTKNSLSFK